MNAKYDGTCKYCYGAILVGDPIDWTRDRGTLHAACVKAAVATAPRRRTRRYWGANFTDLNRGSRPERYQSNYTRFNSGAEIYTNKRGRCEDAPCCGCCS